jgi:hypothetical protein
MLQLLFGCTSLLTAFYPMKQANIIAGTPQDFIYHNDAPKNMLRDIAKPQMCESAQAFCECM